MATKENKWYIYAQSIVDNGKKSDYFILYDGKNIPDRFSSLDSLAIKMINIFEKIYESGEPGTISWSYEIKDLITDTGNGAFSASDLDRPMLRFNRNLSTNDKQELQVLLEDRFIELHTKEKGKE